TIVIPTALPAITDSVIIDGFSQPGASANSLDVGNDAVILVELRGDGADLGLRLEAGNGSTIRGLSITGFLDEAIGILVDGAVIEGNFIGIDPTGAAVPNEDGILIQNGVGTRIGGTTPAARNVISGNVSIGIALGPLPGLNIDQVVIQGNYIGVSPDGASPLGNGAIGVYIDGATNTLVGGATPAARNVISGNGIDGITIIGDPIFVASGTVIQGNYIGLNATGTSAIGNGEDGVYILDAPDTSIIGNVISGNGINGIGVEGAAAAGTIILSNLIGLNATG